MGNKSASNEFNWGFFNRFNEYRQYKIVERKQMKNISHC